MMPAGVAALLRAGHRERVGIKQPGNGSEWAVANRWLWTEANELRAAKVTRAFDEQQIRDYAENYSRTCGRMRSVESRMSFALYVGVEPPAGKALSPSGIAARLDDPLWWRRQLRKRWTRAAENSMRALGVVRKDREPYASNEAVRHRSAQRRRAKDFLRACVAVNEAGEQLELLKLAEHSLANPAIRRSEFMTRVRGFEEVSEDHGHVAEFITLTCPSFFHAQLASGGRNPAFQRSVVREAQSWLCRQWAKARAKLKRLSILYYGFRIAEPHHDGTPHWHVLAFLPAHAVEAFRAVVRGCWLSEAADEPGSAKHRCKFETIDPRQGSATGYVAKYVSKNIDGEGDIGGSEDFETDGKIRDGIARVAAWASIHGIRQFQQIGGPPVGLWREFRRLREGHPDPDLERVRACADDGDFRRFIHAVGGVACGRRTNPRLYREPSAVLNRYGESRPDQTIGVRYASAIAVTRMHVWRIDRKCRGSGLSEQPAGTGRACAAEAPRQTARLSASSLRSDSPLGPVAITVRDRTQLITESPRYAWIATAPYRAQAGPSSATVEAKPQ